ncbi:hypothetical protein LXA43DRAFT_1066778 [Ganoderma leucocontextum]|nr:hypothetical protein LXA43DRAFT_1066778 [Ganoderma leucocontextum]
MKGKGPAHDNANDGTDEVPGRYSIFDLEGIDNSSPVRRYTIFELAQRLLQLAIFEVPSDGYWGYTCREQAVINTFEFPPPTATSASVHRSLQVAMGSRVTSPIIGTSSARVATSRPTPHSVQHINQPAAEAVSPHPAEHPLVPIPEGANPIPVEFINIDDDNPAVSSWYIVTTGSTVGVFDDVTVAQRAARVSGGSWQRCTSRQAALTKFRHAVARNVVVVRP